MFLCVSMSCVSRINNLQIVHVIADAMSSETQVRTTCKVNLPQTPRQCIPKTGNDENATIANTMHLRVRSCRKETPQLGSNNSMGKTCMRWSPCTRFSLLVKACFCCIRRASGQQRVRTGAHRLLSQLYTDLTLSIESRHQRSPVPVKSEIRCICSEILRRTEDPRRIHTCAI